MTEVPCGASGASEIVYDPSPLDSQRTPSLVPALRVISVTVSATMKLE